MRSGSSTFFAPSPDRMTTGRPTGSRGWLDDRLEAE
jgi:hypothetical protein